MKKEDVIKVYKRIYDNPKDKNGKEKPNEFLGEFKVEKVLMEDMYDEKWIGIKDGKKYLIEGIEVSGMRNPEIGGERFEVHKLD